MAEPGSGLRAYAPVRRSPGNPQLHIANGVVAAVCAAHVAEFAHQVLGAPASAKAMDATIRLVANRPDIDAELQALEIAGKGRSTCTVCANGIRWKPKGRPVSMADLADSAPKALA